AARWIAQRVEDDVRPEPGAVLAHALGFGLVAALARRGFQRPHGNTRGPVLWREEAGEVLTDDFGGGVALDPLGSGVPGGYATFGIEHVDGVIGDTGDQQM